VQSFVRDFGCQCAGDQFGKSFRVNVRFYIECRVFEKAKHIIDLIIEPAKLGLRVGIIPFDSLFGPDKSPSVRDDNPGFADDESVYFSGFAPALGDCDLLTHLVTAILGKNERAHKKRGGNDRDSHGVQPSSARFTSGTFPNISAGSQNFTCQTDLSTPLPI